MKKSMICLLCSTLIFSGCGTNTGTGTYIGAQFGSILGSAIGGLSGGPRGSDLGTIVGMVSGAAVGAAIGESADKAEAREVHDHYAQVQERKNRLRTQDTDTVVADDAADESGFDATNSGDDRLYDFQGSDYTGDYSAAQPETKMPSESSVESATAHLSYTPNIEIRNARFVDDNEDGVLSRGETGKVIFEVMNRGQRTLYDVVPSVVVSSRNRHIRISPSIHVESIAPGQGIRYTAVVVADEGLRDGQARFALTVLQGGKSISKVTEFNVVTRK